MSIGQAIYSTYIGIRKPLAVILLVLVFGFRFISVPLIQSSVLTALGLLVLQILFEVHKKITTTDIGILHYSNIQATFPHMTSLIDKSLKKREHTQVSVMGLTLYHMWEYLKNYLNRKDVHDMDIYLSMIDSGVPQIKNLHNNWAEISNGFYHAIANYITSHKKDLLKRGIQIQIDKYKHIPIIHGVLINDEHLFFSFTSWNEEDEMEGATTFYICYNTKTPIGRDHIKLFSNWLEHIKRRKCERICFKLDST